MPKGRGAGGGEEPARTASTGLRASSTRWPLTYRPPFLTSRLTSAARIPRLGVRAAGAGGAGSAHTLGAEKACRRAQLGHGGSHHGAGRCRPRGRVLAQRSQVHRCERHGARPRPKHHRRQPLRRSQAILPPHHARHLLRQASLRAPRLWRRPVLGHHPSHLLRLHLGQHEEQGLNVRVVHAVKVLEQVKLGAKEGEGARIRALSGRRSTPPLSPPPAARVTSCVGRARPRFLRSCQTCRLPLWSAAVW